MNYVSAFNNPDRSHLRDHYRSIQLKKHYEKLEAMQHENKLRENVRKMATDQDNFVNSVKSNRRLVQNF